MDEISKNRLLDMREYAAKAVRYIEDVSYEDFCRDEIKNLAVSRLVEIVGEAATHVRPEVRDRFEGIPWKKIIGARVILAHAYMRIDLRTIYEVASDYLPKLIEQLDKILGNEHDHDT